MKKIFTLTILLLAIQAIFTTVFALGPGDVTYATTSPTCSNDGSVTFTVNNTEGATLAYYMIAPGTSSPVVNPAGVANRVFSNLGSGTYTFQIFANGATTPFYNNSVTLSGGFPTMRVQNIVTGTDYSICGDNGTLALGWTGGRAPYSIVVKRWGSEVRNIPNYNSTSISFVQLQGGQHTFEITDACGAKITNSETVNITSLPLTSLTSLAISNISHSGTANECEAAISFNASNVVVNSNSNMTTQFTNSGKLTYTVIVNGESYADFPSSGVHHFYVPHTGTSETPYTIQVKNECDQSVVTKSGTLPKFEPIYKIENNGVEYYTDMCNLPAHAGFRITRNQDQTLTNKIPNFSCFQPGYKITVTKTADNSSQEFIWNSGTYYPIIGLDWNTQYAVTVEDPSNNVVMASTNMTTITAPTLFSFSVSATGNGSLYSCSPSMETKTNRINGNYSAEPAFKNGSIRVKFEVTESTPAKIGSPYPTIIKSFSNYDNTYTDEKLFPYLEAGTHKIMITQIDASGNAVCTGSEKILTITPDRTFRNVSIDSKTKSATCGVYNLTVSAKFNNATGGDYGASTACITLEKKDADGNWQSFYSSGTNNTTHTIQSVGAGDYKLTAYPATKCNNWYNTQYGNDYDYERDVNCAFGSYEFTMDSYVAPVIDASKSGGIACTGTAGTLFVVLQDGTGVGTNVQYSLDGTTWQTNNYFENQVVGNHNVYVKDDCGYTSTASLLNVADGTTPFLMLANEIETGKVCAGQPVTFMVRSIGPVQTYTWYRYKASDESDIVTLDDSGGNSTYTIENPTNDDFGWFYKVVIFNGTCTLPSSKKLVGTVASPNAPTLSYDNCSILTATNNNSTGTLDKYIWYKDGVEVARTDANTYTPATSEIGIYTVAVSISGEQCTSPESNKIVVANDTELYWKENAVNTTWEDAQNWVDKRGDAVTIYPTACVDVHIPGNAERYPTLVAGDACRDIYFHWGAEVGKTHLLTYEKAFVQYNFGYYASDKDVETSANTYKTDGDKYSATPMLRGRWYALAAPLKQMASGDFSVGGLPTFWQQGFKASDAGGAWKGEWYAPVNSNALNIGSAEMNNAISIWAGEYFKDDLFEGNHSMANALKGVFEMPYFENTNVSNLHRIHQYSAPYSRFYYYYSNEGLPISNIYDQIDRTGAYRFIFDGNLTNSNEYSLPIPANKELMIGNPIMSSLDFDALYTANSSSIENIYRLYNGTGFVSYANGVSADGLTKKIASYQGFFIQSKSEATALKFPFNDVSVTRNENTDHQFKAPSAYSSVIPNSNILYAYTTINGERSGMAVVYSEGNSIHRLFSTDTPQYPQIYGANDGDNSKNEFVFTSSDIVNIGVNCSSNTDAVFSVNVKDETPENLSSTFAGSGLYLLDKKLNITTDLFVSGGTYAYVHDSSYPDRFQLISQNVFISTFVDQTSVKNTELNAYANGKTIFVTANKEMETITIISVSGVRVLSAQSNATSYSKTTTLPDGVYLIEVLLKNGEKEVRKVVLK